MCVDVDMHVLWPFFLSCTRLTVQTHQTLCFLRLARSTEYINIAVFCVHAETILHEVVSPSFLGNLSLTLYVQDSCIICVWRSPCVKVYVVRKAMSQKQGYYRSNESSQFHPAYTKMTGFIFLVGCMCPMECRLRSTATDYEEVSSRMNLWKLHLRWLYFT